jgi:hypothetical protein
MMTEEFDRKIVVCISVVAAIVCFLVYLRALSCDFINWDDTDYLVNNQIFRSLDLEMVVKSFTTVPINFWTPLTWISYAVDYYFWGMNPTGYHLTNNIIHSVNAALFVFIADRLIRWRPEFLSMALGDHMTGVGSRLKYGMLLLFVTLLWGIHPARVESVAWATERKDVLHGLFLFGAIHYYLQYSWGKTRAPNSGATCRPYLLSLLFFTLSLMAKPSGVVMPMMLLVLDWYPADRFRRGEIFILILEKIPYFLLAAGVAAITIIVGSTQGAYLSLDEFPISVRFIVIGTALFEYVKLVINPSSILPYYHLPFNIPVEYMVKACAAYTIFVIIIYVGMRIKWMLAVTAMFVIPLLPVLQFFPNGFQPTLCTRYTYTPTLVPSIIFAMFIFISHSKLLLASRRYSANILVGLMLLLIVYYGVVTQRLIGEWKNSGTFWTRVIETQPFDRAYFYRGLFFFDTGNYAAAVQDYTSTLELLNKTRSLEAFNLYAFRGEALAKAGRYEEAVRDFDAVIAIYPHRLYFYHRGNALIALGRINEGTKDLARAGQAKGQMYWFPPGTPLQ